MALTQEGIKFSDFVRGLPAATESDLSAGNNMPIVSASDIKKMGGENVAKAGDVADIAVMKLSLYGSRLKDDVPAGLTASAYFYYWAEPVIGHKITLEYINQNTSGTAYFALIFYNAEGSAISTINGNANGGQTKTYSAVVPVGSSKVAVRSPGYTKAHFELFISDPIVDNFVKDVVAEPRFNYNNMADVVVAPGETKQVRVNTNTFFPLCLKGKRLTIKSIIDCPISSNPSDFGYWDSKTYDSILGQWTLKKSVTVDNYKVSDTRSNAFMYSSFTNNTDSPIVARLNKVIYEFENANDADDYRKYLSMPEEVRDLDNYWTYEIHVGASYTTATEGWGVTKFNSPWQAVNACKGHGSNQLEHCRVVIEEPGTYDISAEIAPSTSSTGTSYLGMILDSYTPSTGVGKYFEMVSADIQKPADYVIKFNGAYNYGSGVMTMEQAMRVALFHIVCTSFAQIKGIKFVGKNGRYCIHPEFGRTSTGSKILFENCIFLWEGDDQVSGYHGCAVGIGIDAGDSITFRKCKWVSAEEGGVSSKLLAHNNGYGSSTDFILSGAKLTLEECDMGGWNHGSFSNNNPNQITHDVLVVNNCVNIGGLSVVNGSNWRLVNIASDIPQG